MVSRRFHYFWITRKKVRRRGLRTFRMYAIIWSSKDIMLPFIQDCVANAELIAFPENLPIFEFMLYLFPTPNSFVLFLFPLHPISVYYLLKHCVLYTQVWCERILSVHTHIFHLTLTRKFVAEYDVDFAFTTFAVVLFILFPFVTSYAKVLLTQYCIWKSSYRVLMYEKYF